MVCKRGGEKQLLEVFDKWDLECVQIGEVTDTGRLEYFMHGAKIADVPAESLVLGGGAPIYVRESVKPAYFELIDAFENTLIEEPVDLVAVAKTLIASENIASKNWIYEQYDKMVRTGTMTSVQSADAALVRVKGILRYCA